MIWTEFFSLINYRKSLKIWPRAFLSIPTIFVSIGPPFISRCDIPNSTKNPAKIFSSKNQRKFRKIKNSIFEKIFSKIKNNDFSKCSLNFRRIFFRGFFGRISLFCVVGRRVWVNCSPNWNEIFAPVFFVLQGID